jgi:hypothetical protein
MQVLRDLSLELTRVFFGAACNFSRFFVRGERLWWVGEVVIGSCGGYCTGDPPTVEFFREVCAKSSVLLVVRRQDGPGRRAGKWVGLVECWGWREAFEYERWEIESQRVIVKD